MLFEVKNELTEYNENPVSYLHLFYVSPRFSVGWTRHTTHSPINAYECITFSENSLLCARLDTVFFSIGCKIYAVRTNKI